MATRDSTTDEVNYLNPDPPPSLRDIIERERGQLDKALTILGCTMVAINNDPCADDHQFVYGEMIDLARQMINKTTNRLDSVYLGGFYAQLALIDACPCMRRAPGTGDSGNGVSAG